jgi:hypothetical protein
MSLDAEKERAALVLRLYPVAKKPLHELLFEAIRLGEELTAALLCCSREYVAFWFPYVRKIDGGIELGYEPSMGFIAAALAILRAHP